MTLLQGDPNTVGIIGDIYSTTSISIATIAEYFQVITREIDHK
jgi:hypothetical protein